LTYTLEISSRENTEVESRVSCTIPGGHLEATVDHLFENMQEELSYRVTNFGYTEKTFEVVVRDEERGVEISREKFTLKGGKTAEGAAVSPSGMYAKDGCKNATIYVLFDGEEYDSPTVDTSRIKSVIPLEEVCGQTPPVIKPNSEPEKPSDNSGNVTPTPTPNVIHVTPQPTRTPASTPAPTAEPTVTPTTRPAPTKDTNTEKPEPGTTAEPELPDNGETRKEKGSWLPWLLLIPLLAGVGLIRFIILLWKRRKEEEEETQ